LEYSKGDGVRRVKIDLKETTVLVTGASRGIGKAIAKSLLQSGARVAIHCHKHRESAEEIASLGDSRIFEADLSKDEETLDLFQRVLQWSPNLNVLVNNAGVFLSAPLESSLQEWIRVWDTTMAINLKASSILCKEAANYFAQHGGGRIISISSRAAFRGDTPEYLAYAASKAGMVALSRSIARGMGKRGVKAFVVAPGFTRTEMAEDALRLYGEQFVVKDLALDRMTEPEDIAPLIVFLASGLGDHMTGATLDVNAGSYVH